MLFFKFCPIDIIIYLFNDIVMGTPFLMHHFYHSPTQDNIISTNLYLSVSYNKKAKLQLLFSWFLSNSWFGFPFLFTPPLFFLLSQEEKIIIVSEIMVFVYKHAPI